MTAARANLTLQLNAYGDNATAGQLNGGAGGPSVRLADDRVVFLADDVYVGPFNGSGVRAHNARVDNALMVWRTSTTPTHPSPPSWAPAAPPTSAGNLAIATEVYTHRSHF